MILRLFKGNQPLVLLLLLPIMALFYALNHYYPFRVSATELDLGLWGTIENISPRILLFASACLVLFNGIQLNYLFNKYDFFEKNTYTPVLVYVILCTLTGSFYQLDILLIVQTILLQVFRFLFRLGTNDDNRKEAFNVGFLAGFAVSLYPILGIFLPVFWISFWIIKGFRFRETILNLLGFSIVLFNVLMFWWFSGHSIGTNLLLEKTNFKFEGLIVYSTAATCLVLLIMSLIGINIRIRKSSIQFKKYNQVILLITVFLLLFGIFNFLFFKQFDWFNLLFVPLSFLFTFSFLGKIWGQVASYVFYLIIVLSVIKFFLLVQK